MTKEMIRSIEEITASAKMNMADMIHRAIALGKDFADAKEQLGHGGFLPWLKELGVSSSTAANYMRVAREIPEGSRLSGLPYSKALALLAAPAEEREELAEEAEGKSAAEIKKLIEERNRAAEAANAESNRANVLQNEVNKLKQYTAELNDELEKTHADLLIAENNVVEVEVVPKDYERLKHNQALLMNAATEAEDRAAAAEARLEEVLQNGAGRASSYELIHRNLKLFMVDCEMLPALARDLYMDADNIVRDLNRMKTWIKAMESALDSAAIGEGAVIVS